MALLTATEVTLYSNISASVGTIVASNLIPMVTGKINMMTNNFFLTDLDVLDLMTFNTTARTIIANGNSFSTYGFAAGDDVYVYQSYRNDGYYSVLSVSDKTLTLATGATVVDELSTRTILISVVKWPETLKYIAAQMIAFDYDVRPSVSINLKSRSLGPWSESYTSESEDAYGYPKKLTDPLSLFRIARLM